MICAFRLEKEKFEKDYKEKKKAEEERDVQKKEQAEKDRQQIKEREIEVSITWLTPLSTFVIRG